MTFATKFKTQFILCAIIAVSSLPLQCGASFHNVLRTISELFVQKSFEDTLMLKVKTNIKNRCCMMSNTSVRVWN